MDINGIGLRLLKLIGRHREPIIDNHLIPRLHFRFTREEFDDGLRRLADKGWITLDDERMVGMTEEGRQFLSEFDRYGEEFTFDGNYLFAVLKFLNDMGDLVAANDFPEVLIGHAPNSGGYPGSHRLMDYLQFDQEINPYVTEQSQAYKLNDSGKAKYAHLAKRLLPPAPIPFPQPGPQPIRITTKRIPAAMSENAIQPAKPLVFIGSSVEGLDILNAIVSNLEFVCEFVLWDAGTFGASEYPLESLLKALVGNKPDFAIFVLSGEDKLESRDIQYRTPRDNVVFELGLAIGSISRHRVFMVLDRGVKVKIPSDLFGVIPVAFDQPQRGNLIAALKPACLKIKAKIEELGLLANEKIEGRKGQGYGTGGRLPGRIYCPA